LILDVDACVLMLVLEFAYSDAGYSEARNSMLIFGICMLDVRMLDVDFWNLLFGIWNLHT
jgi:hypothetical protein